jgi:hypothetical protein
MGLDSIGVMFLRLRARLRNRRRMSQMDQTGAGIAPFTCFFDVDNTLIDNDAIKADLDANITAIVGQALARRFWALYEAVRQEGSVVDYPKTMARLRPELAPAVADQVWDAIWNYPFKARLYPESLAAIRHMQALGCVTGIVSDGDSVYQPHKIEASGLAAAVHGHVKIFIHKQSGLDEIMRWLPARHYVAVDDKATILADFKRRYPRQFTTIHVRQGHYAAEEADPAPDITLDHIGGLLRIGRDQLQ